MIVAAISGAIMKDGWGNLAQSWFNAYQRIGQQLDPLPWITWLIACFSVGVGALGLTGIDRFWPSVVSVLAGMGGLSPPKLELAALADCAQYDFNLFDRPQYCRA